MKAKTIQLVTFAVISYAMLVSGCSQKSTAAKSGTQKPAKNSSQVTTSSGFTALSSLDSSIYLKDKLTTLRNIVSTNQKKLSVFQFSGITCLSCQEESPGVQSQLAQLNDVASYVVFPNVDGAYTKERYEGFISKYAKGATYMVDPELDMLLSVRNPQIAEQFFGIYVIMKPDGTARVYNQEDAYQTIVSEVKKYL